MARFACARQVVILSREDDELSSRSVKFQSSEPLLALFKWHSQIVVRMKYQNRCLYIFGIFQRRALPIQIEFFKQVSIEISPMSISSVARSFVAYEIRYAAKRNGGFEQVRMTDDPIGQISAI